MSAQTNNYVLLLGTKGGPAVYPGSAMPTSSLLVLDGHTVLVDCGLGVTRALADHGFALSNLRTIVITHLHSDHYLELGPLLHTAWVSGLSASVRVIGPEGLAAYWTHFIQSMAADIELRIRDEGRPNLAEIVWIDVLEEGQTHLGTIRMDAIRNDHPPLTDSFALSFKGARKHVVFSGDTAHLPALVELSWGADLLVHEAMLEEALADVAQKAENGDDRLMAHLERSHCSAQDAGRIASDAGVKALALHHLIPSGHADYSSAAWDAAVRQTWGGQLFIGSDGLRIDL
ncbi:MAG: MBL fold metallo-hydrolase [Pseudomonadota bacterium]